MTDRPNPNGKTARERLGRDEFLRRCAEARRERAARRLDRNLRQMQYETALWYRREFPDGCERCGEQFDAGGPAEIVDSTGEHLIVHAETCVNGDPLA